MKIEVIAEGPYRIQSECLIAHSNGREETKTGIVLLCRCGASANKPYSDDSHGKIGFAG
jgi:CDGSH-type Zn-finger protein